nr:IS5 family transposase [Saccharomonospora piscinae]
MLPAPDWLAGHGGRRAKHCRREIVDAIFYQVDNGITWRALPADFPPWSTVYNHFAAWESAGVTQDMLDGPRDRVRLAEGRNAAPSAGSIDSASVKASETVGAASRGFDAGKKINGRKRHIAVDTLGLLICVLVTTAGVQDRVAARNLLARLRYVCPSIRHLWADSGYTGTLITWAKALFGVGIDIDIVAKLAGQTGFVVLHRRWVVERTLAWINQHRPLRTRLRTPPRTPRSPLGHDPHHHQQTPHTSLGTSSAWGIRQPASRMPHELATRPASRHRRDARPLRGGRTVLP